MPIMTVLLWWAMANPRPQINNVVSCYSRYSGFCQTTPLTDAEQEQDGQLITELGDRRDLTAANIIYLGQLAEQRWRMDTHQFHEALLNIMKSADAYSSGHDATAPLKDAK